LATFFESYKKRIAQWLFSSHFAVDMLLPMRVLIQRLII